MTVDTAHYHGWQGKLGSPSLGIVAIIRVAMLQVFRRKLYWGVLGLALLQFAFYWAIIYAVTQVQLPREARQAILDNFGFSATSDAQQNNGYIEFMQKQSIVVMLLLTFSGSLLVGADFRHNSLPFFLSRRIDRRHYIAGKLLSVSTLVAMITVVPALLLFMEYGMFTSSARYWVDNWRIAGAVLGYGAVLCATLSTLLVTISAYMQKAAPIAIAWITMFALPTLLLEYKPEWMQGPYWNLVDVGRDIHLVGKLLFATVRAGEEHELAQAAAGILLVVCSLALVALVHRVRAVEIME